LKALNDLDAELDEFNKNGRLGVLKGIKEGLKDKLAKLNDVEKRLKELEVGIDETQKKLADRKSKIDNKDPN
jgi:peptidoglycan hydrolase CwlO-like protein